MQRKNVIILTILALFGWSLPAFVSFDAAAASNVFEIVKQALAAPSGEGIYNLALYQNGGRVTVSSSINPTMFPASAAINGDRKGIGWESGGGWNDATADSYPDSMTITFNGMKEVSEIDVFTLQDNYQNPVEPTFGTMFNLYGITDFNVQYLDSAGSWVTVPNGFISNNRNVWRQFSFATPITTTAIRIYITGALSSFSRIVEVEAWGRDLTTNELIWVDDSLPAGSVAGTMNEAWQWTSSNPTPLSGMLAHRSSLYSGIHQHYFDNASSRLTINPGNVLTTWIYIDPASPPQQVMLQWFDASGTWEHRAYWAASSNFLIPWGVEGTVSHRYMGALPPSGQWVKLEVPAAQVGLEGVTISGMAFTLYGGTATWDRSGKQGSSASTPTPTPTPVSLPNITIADASRAEGNSGTTNLSFTVSLSAVSSQPVSVNYATVNQTAIAPGDYTTVGGVLNIPAGQTTGTILVPISGDTVAEGNETFAVNLSNAVNATISDGQAVGTINNDDAATPTGEIQNPALFTSGGNAAANGGTNIQSVNNAEYKVYKDDTAKYWSGNVNNELTVTFAQTYKIAVVRLYFPQNVNPPIEPKPATGTPCTTSPQSMQDFDVSYQKPDGSWALMQGGQIRNNTCVMVRVSFPDLTDVKAIKVKVVRGGTDGGPGKLAELEAWRTIIPYSACEKESLPDPCGMLADLDWVMKGYVGSEPHPNWEGRLDWDYSRWNASSENWGPIAHAIALWKPVPGQDSVGWWKTVLDCQTGGPCNVSVDIAPKLRYFKGSELFSAIYDGSTTMAVVAVHYWAKKNNDTVLETKAERYLRATWGSYTLAAGNSYAVRVDIENGDSPDSVPNCQTNATGTPFFDGPFISMAGMRTTPSSLCQDGRGPLFNHALNRTVANNKRESLDQRAIAAYIQANWNGTNKNVYGLTATEYGTNGVLWRHITGNQLAVSYILDNMFRFNLGNNNYQYIHTIVPYRFLGWGGTTPIRVTVMESNKNGNTTPTYAVRYDSSTMVSLTLYPWNKDLDRVVGTEGYARLEDSFGNPNAENPVRITASNDNNQAHGPRTVTMTGIPPNPGVQGYQVVLSPTANPTIVNW
ncbi:MAG: Calx-beta domain-containing protein [Pyrinomonadaceae bacterium]